MSAEVVITHLSDQALDRIASYFKALADSNRLRIVWALMERKCGIGELVHLLGGSQANMTHPDVDVRIVTLPPSYCCRPFKVAA